MCGMYVRSALRTIGALAAVGWSLVSACDAPGRTVCAGVGYYALTLQIRDQRGRPQAFHTTIMLSTDGRAVDVMDAFDSLTVDAASEGDGHTYDLTAWKFGYDTTTIHDIVVPSFGFCPIGDAIKPVTVPVTLQVAVDAPPVRSIYLLPQHILLDRPPHVDSVTFNPYVDADPDVSRAVRWALTGDTASVGFDSTTGTLRYRCLPQSGYLTLRAISLVDSTVRDSASIAVQGHPAASDDPPCR